MNSDQRASMNRRLVDVANLLDWAQEASATDEQAVDLVRQAKVLLDDVFAKVTALDTALEDEAEARDEFVRIKT